MPRSAPCILPNTFSSPAVSNLLRIPDARDSLQQAAIEAFPDLALHGLPDDIFVEDRF